MLAHTPHTTHSTNSWGSISTIIDHWGDYSLSLQKAAGIITLYSIHPLYTPYTPYTIRYTPYTPYPPYPPYTVLNSIRIISPGPGHWNDMDMILAGDDHNKIVLPAVEAKTQLTIWSIMVRGYYIVTSWDCMAWGLAGTAVTS
jgi:hypothetical protein